MAGQRAHLPSTTPKLAHPSHGRTYALPTHAQRLRIAAPPSSLSSSGPLYTASPPPQRCAALSLSHSARRQLNRRRPSASPKALALSTGLDPTSGVGVDAPSARLHSRQGRGTGRGRDRERGSWAAGAGETGARSTGRSSVARCEGVAHGSADTANTDEGTGGGGVATGPTTEVNGAGSSISTNSDSNSSSSVDRDSSRADAVSGDSGGPGENRNGASMSADERLNLRNLVLIEMWIEQKVLNARFQAVAAVVGALCGATLCFLRGTGLVIAAVAFALRNGFQPSLAGSHIIMNLIHAIDVYLVGTVMLIFGVGLYELFVHPLQAPGGQGQGSGSSTEASASTGGSTEGVAQDRVPESNLFGLFPMRARLKSMDISSLDELKTKLGHVIVLILMVQLYEKSKKVRMVSALDFFLFSASTTLAALCMLLLSKLGLQNGSSSKGPANGAARS